MRLGIVSLYALVDLLFATWSVSKDHKDIAKIVLYVSCFYELQEIPEYAGMPVLCDSYSYSLYICTSCTHVHNVLMYSCTTRLHCVFCAMLDCLPEETRTLSS